MPLPSWWNEADAVLNRPRIRSGIVAPDVIEPMDAIGSAETVND